jgi:nucleoside-diphosphate-sugar epimerase
MGQHILITGGAGYLGSIATARFLEAGHRVTVLDNLMYGQHSLFHLCADPRFQFVLGDARDERVLAPLVQEADAILHLACIVGAAACDRDPLAARSINVDSVKLLIRLRQSGQRLVYPTTNSGYGTRSGATFCTEETPLDPISLYGETKVEAERLLLAEPNTIAFRLATVFGMSPRMRLDLLVNHFTLTAVTDRYLVIFEKDFKRNYVHIRDVADAFLYAFEHGDGMVGRTFNLGLDHANLSKAELAEAIRRQVPGFFIHYAEVGSDPDKRDYIVSNQRLREAGFEATRSLDDGIRELIKGYRMLGRGAHRNA